MAKVCFYFEPYDRDVFSGNYDAINAWNYAMKIPGDITDVTIVNSSGISLAGLDGYFNWDIRTDLPDFEGRVTHLVTGYSNQYNMSLWDFDHQTDWYVFGPASGWDDKIAGVYIPQHNPDIKLHATHVVTAVMFHRYHVIGG